MSPGEPPSEPAAPRVCTKQAPALRDADPVLAQLIDNRPDFDPRAWMARLPPMELCDALLFQVTGQQRDRPVDPAGHPLVALQREAVQAAD